MGQMFGLSKVFGSSASAPQPTGFGSPSSNSEGDAAAGAFDSGLDTRLEHFVLEAIDLVAMRSPLRSVVKTYP